jgi:DNA-nicking Smr family endonuclease
MRRRHRKLSAEERALWAQVAASTAALHPPCALTPEQPAPAAPPPKHSIPRPEIPDFRIGSSAPAFRARRDLAPAPAERLAQAPLRMDHKAHQKMRRGRIEPEARIDLHGMTLAQAHPELIRFVLSAQAAGKRLVLVITGKGRIAADDGPIPLRHGVLRHQVPIWLHQAPLANAVLQVAPAHLRHGGTGAYYIYLRRSR